MDPINIDIDLENRPPSVTQDMEQSEEEVHIPFTFVDVNRETDIDIELDVDPHPASSFADINHEEVLIPINYDTLKSEDEERHLADKAVLKVEDKKVDGQGQEIDLESEGTLREVPAFQCKVCNKGFRYKTELKIHSRSHTGWVNYSKVHLLHKPHLIDHSYCITGSKTRLCHLCNKEFTKLEEHYRTHTGEKPYKCGVCDRLFSLRGTLKRHLTIHTGDKCHQCSVCFKGLSSERSLRNHELLHKKCKISSQSLRKKHIRCEICFKRVFNKGNLSQHYRTHEKESCNPRGVKPFKCKMCSKQFSSASTFKRHSRMHC